MHLRAWSAGEGFSDLDFNSCSKLDESGPPYCNRTMGHLGRCAHGKELARYLDALGREHTSEDVAAFNRGDRAKDEASLLLRTRRKDCVLDAYLEQVDFHVEQADSYVERVDECSEEDELWSERVGWLNERFVEKVDDEELVGKLLKSRGRAREMTRGEVRGRVRQWLDVMGKARRKEKQCRKRKHVSNAR